VTDNPPPSKEALNRVKLKKQKEKDLPKGGGKIRRKVTMLCPLSRLVFLVSWPKANLNSSENGNGNNRPADAVA